MTDRRYIPGIKTLIAAIIVITGVQLYADDAKVGAFAAGTEAKLIQHIFAGNEKVAGCKVISRGPGAKLGDYDAGLQQFTNLLLDVLKDNKEDELGKFFHPRLNKNGDIGRRLFATLRNKYEQPWQFSIYRVFALNTVAGEKVTIPCADDGMTITTLYGYPLQFGIWVQVMAQNELSRIFMLVVPRDGVWYIGGFHIQQWTYMGKDFEKWAAEGVAQLAAKDMITAYVKLDVAQKMLFGGDFLTYPVKDKVLGFRNEALSKDGLLNKIKEVTKNPNIVYAGTALGADGPGFVIREKTLKDMSTVELKASCFSMGKALLAAGLIKGDFGGVSCDFIYPNEDRLKKGAQGGFFYSHKELESK